METPAVKPKVGQIVGYIPQPGTFEAANGADLIPAIIVRVWGDGALCNLKAFNDGVDAPLWLGSVSYDSTAKTPRTYHFIE